MTWKSDIDTVTAYENEIKRKIAIVDDSIKILTENNDTGIKNSSLGNDIEGDTKLALKNLKRAKNLLVSSIARFR